MRKFFIKSTFKFLLKFSLYLILVVFALIWLSNYRINATTSEYVSDDYKDLPSIKVGVVLGTSPKLANGYSNYYFTYRIEAAERLYHSGKVTHFIVSGDHGRKDYNEPDYMKQVLVEKGIPSNRIYVDYAGFRTLDSMVRAKEIFGQNKFIVISQRFHNQRAIFIARQYGIEAYGYNATDVNIRGGMKTRIREYFARTKVFVDQILGVEPRYLGEKIEIL